MILEGLRSGDRACDLILTEKRKGVIRDKKVLSCLSLTRDDKARPAKKATTQKMGLKGKQRLEPSCDHGVKTPLSPNHGIRVKLFPNSSSLLSRVILFSPFNQRCQHAKIKVAETHHHSKSLSL